VIIESIVGIKLSHLFGLGLATVATGACLANGFALGRLANEQVADWYRRVRTREIPDHTLLPVAEVLAGMTPETLDRLMVQGLL